jgi:hypothetical protein
VVVEDAQLSVSLGDGSGGFGPTAAIPLPASFGPRSALVDDVDGDGQSDLVVGGAVANAGTGLEEAHVAVLLGDGAGGHLPPVSYPTDPMTAGITALTAADLDGDGVRDIVAGNSDEYRYDPDASVSVLVGIGDGTFGPAVTTPMDDHPVLAVDAADMDDDGLPDVAVAADDAGAFVLFSDGSGALGDAHYLMPGGGGAIDLVAVDQDGDGVPDIVTAGPKVTFFPNRLDGERTHP